MQLGAQQWRLDLKPLKPRAEPAGLPHRDLSLYAHLLGFSFSEHYLSPIFPSSGTSESFLRLPAG